MKNGQLIFVISGSGDGILGVVGNLKSVWKAACSYHNTKKSSWSRKEFEEKEYFSYKKLCEAFRDRQIYRTYSIKAPELNDEGMLDIVVLEYGRLF